MRSKRAVGAVAFLLAVGCVLAAGAVGYARVAERAAATTTVDGVTADCGPHRAVDVVGEVGTAGPVRAFVDGVEVPVGSSGDDPVAVLLPPALDHVDCTAGATHRYAILADASARCRWLFGPVLAQTDARGGEILRYPGVAAERCAVTVVG